MAWELPEVIRNKWLNTNAEVEGMLNASPKLSAGQNGDDALLTESIFTSQFRRPGIYLVL